MSSVISPTTTIRLTIIGDSGAGKSSLTLKYTNNKFDQNSISTIGIDFKLKQIIHNNTNYKVHIWDTAGQERYRTITSSYYRSCEGIVFVYSVTDKKSFVNIKNWIADCTSHINFNDVQKILIGNKSDDIAHREVSYEDGEQFARINNLNFFETSAKAGHNVDYAFTEIVKLVIENKNKPKGINKINNPSIKIKKPDNPPKNPRSWCIIL
jgi:Ras-related protein Rab-1A